MIYLGDFAEDDTVYLPFSTYTSDDPAASSTITELADADIKVHKDGAATPIATDGATVVINLNSITGSHMITINTGIDAAYSTGSEYSVKIEGTLVDSGTINGWVGTFSIERAGGVLALVKAGVTLAAGAVTDASLAGGLEIIFETDFGTNYNVTRKAWVTNGTDFIGTGWNVAKTGYALSTADWNVGKSGYSLTTTPASATEMAKVPKSDSTVSWNATALGAINTEVDNALNVTTYAEPAQGLPAATTTLQNKIGFLYKAWRNKSVQNATTYELYNDDASTVDHKATCSDDTTTATKGEVATGP